MDVVSTEKFFRLFKGCFDESAIVLRDFFDFSIIEKKYSDSFLRCLDDKKHDIYHEWQSTTPCCFCGSKFTRGKRTLEEKIFRKLFEIRNEVKCNRTRKGINGVPLCFCFCKVISIQTLTLAELDITVLSYLIRFYGISNDATKSIAEIRNNLAHQKNTGALKKDEYKDMWAKLEHATFTLAEKVGRHYAFSTQRLLKTVKESGIGMDEMENLAKKFDLITSQDSNGYQSLAKEIKHHMQTSTDAQTKTIKDGQAEIKQTLISQTGNISKVSEKIDRLEELLLGIYSKTDKNLNTDVAMEAKKEKVQSESKITATNKYDVGVQVNLSDLNEAETISRLRDRKGEEKPGTLRLDEAEHKCINLDMTADQEMFQSEETFKFAIDDLIDRIIEAGEIDTSIRNTMKITLTFKSPLSNEQRKVVTSMLTKYGKVNKSVTSDNINTTRLDDETASSSTERPETKSVAISKDEGFKHQDEIEIKGVRKRVSLKYPGKIQEAMFFEEEDSEIITDFAARTLINAGNLIFHVGVKGLPEKFLDSESESWITEKDDKECFVEWRWICPQTFEVDTTASEIKSKIPELRGWFEIDYVSEDKSGNLRNLVIQTRTPAHTFTSQTSLDTAIRSFLLKTVEVCSIPTTDALSIIVDLTVLSGLKEDSETDLIQDEEPELKKRKTEYGKEKERQVGATVEDVVFDYAESKILECQTSLNKLEDRLKRARQMDTLSSDVKQKIISIEILIREKKKIFAAWQTVFESKTRSNSELVNSTDYCLEDPYLVCSSCTRIKAESTVYLCKQCNKNLCGVCYIGNKTSCRILQKSIFRKSVNLIHEITIKVPEVILSQFYLPVTSCRCIRCLGTNELVILTETVISIIDVDGNLKRSVMISADSFDVIDIQTLVSVKHYTKIIKIMTLAPDEPTYRTIEINEKISGPVCFYSGKIYIGCKKSIKIIDLEGKEMGHISISDVDRICVFNDTLYCYHIQKETLISYDLHNNNVIKSRKCYFPVFMDTDWNGNIIFAFTCKTNVVFPESELHVFKTDRNLNDIILLLKQKDCFLRNLCVDKISKLLVTFTRSDTVRIYKITTK